MTNTKLRRVIGLCLIFFIPVFAWGQTKTVTGVVKDALGETIIGASILEVGTTNGTVTDMDGSFSLRVAENATLNISYVGFMTQAVSVRGKTALTITLEEDTQSLEEVVVVGYGTARKADISGAIASADARIIQEIPAVDASAALQGRMPGIEILQTGTAPGSAMQIRIRGERSLSADNNPLIVLDGIPFNGSLSDISPNDIKTIDILKDASSTAIYGSRGANGVILITTNRGSLGQTPAVNYSGYYGVKNVLKRYNAYSGPEFVAFHDASLKAGTYPYSVLQQEVIASGNYTDWQDLFYQPGHVTNHELSVSSGSQRGAYSFSGGYFNETAVVPLQEYTRFTLRTTVDQEIGKYVKVGLTTNTTFGVGDNLGWSPMGDILTNMTPISPSHNADGSIVTFPLDGTIDATFTNPLYTLVTENARAEQSKRIASFNSLYGEVKLYDGLTYRFNVGLSYSQENYGLFSNGADYPGNPPSVSSATVRNTQWQQWTVENLLYYNKVLAEKHRLNATAMYSAEQSQFQRSSMQATDIAADYLLYYNLSMANGEKNINSGTSNQNYWQRGLQSLMARVQYSYDDRYMLTATFRSDGSSVLSPGKKWHSYPAFSLGWNANREAFMKDIESISQLKLRLGYGQTSNQAVSPYQTLGGLGMAYYNYGPGATGQYGYYVTDLPNSNLGWEYTQNYNLGVDYNLFNGRISGYLDVYLQKTSDLLLSVRLPSSSGVDRPIMQNVGSTENKGLEFAINGQIIKPQTAGDFSFNADFNIYFNRNKITALASGEERNIDNGWFVGYPINVMYDYVHSGIWQLGEEAEAAKYGYKPGQIKVADLDNSSTITADGDRKIVGTFEPDFSGGLTLRFGYRNFDFSAVSFFRMGGHLMSMRHYDYNITHTGRRNSTKVDYWTPTNPVNKYPQPGNQSGETIDFASTLRYFDATFLKVRTLSLGYTFQKNILNHVGARSARLYVTCQNPFPAFFSPYMKEGAGVDPEPTQYSTTTNLERQLWVGFGVPVSRNFLLGLNVSF
ncbi:MAG: TonB-dependent receptor [Tannerella sp.]|jgi:TonB-linked SusC/RagA family outer membrane protein|nr:TonB-dependent receptor [Tannerella sp.]